MTFFSFEDKEGTIFKVFKAVVIPCLQCHATKSSVYTSPQQSSWALAFFAFPRQLQSDIDFPLVNFRELYKGEL